MKSVQLLITLLLLIAFALTFFVTGSVEAAFDWTDSEEFKQIIKNVERWRGLVEYVIENQHSRYYIHLDPNLVLALIAQESMGNPYAISSDKWGSIGLMQVTPRFWIGTKEQLMNPKFNLEWGIWFLDRARLYSDGDNYEALRIYNCGPERASEKETCGSWYDDRVLNFWHPYFLFDKYQESFYTGIRSIYLVP